MTAAEAAEVERLADAAWPAAEQAPLGPWKLRATHGVTRRANSAFTAGGPDVGGAELDDLIESAERFYERRALPPTFQVSDGTGARGLDAALAARGYRVNGASEVWTLGPPRPASAGELAADRVGWTIRREGEPDERWFDCAFDEPLDRRRVHEQIVRRVPRPRLFVTASVDGQVAGCGMSASAAGYAGLFAMVTRAEYRRRGIGLALVRELCAWAAGRGDGRVYLQVMRENDAAKGLYRKAGFGLGYRYHYRVNERWRDDVSNASDASDASS